MPPTVSNHEIARHHAAAQMLEQITPFPPFPSELILKILKYLPQNDLRSASQSSNAFYYLALAAGLYIPLTVGWTPLGFSRSLEKLALIVYYAERHRPGLNIGIRATLPHSSNGAAETTPTIEGFFAAETTPTIERLFASVTRALPYLVCLEVITPQSVPATAYELLCAHPAPRLRAFSIFQMMGTSVTIPRDLFMRDAPRLREFSVLFDTAEALRSWAAVPALRRITRLQMHAREALQHVVQLARLFPALSSLVLGVVGTPGAGTIDISGLNLEELVLPCGADGLVDPAAMAEIPIVEHSAGMAEMVWPAASAGALCVHAEEVPIGRSAVSVGPADGAGQWRRTLERSQRDGLLPLADVPMASSRLVSITLAMSFLNAFIRLPMTLGALRELFIDVSGEQGASGPLIGLDMHIDALAPAVRCPAIERVIIFAMPSRYPVTVRPSNVTRLGRALSLGSPGPKPTLTLAGCAFHDPPIWPALNWLFSGVEAVDCSGDRVPAYYRTCRFSGFFKD